MKATRAALKQRLSSYWQLEAFNALLLPVTGIIILSVADEKPDLASIASMVATVVMLLIGAAYWHAKLGLLLGMTKYHERTVRLLRHAKLPSGLLIIGSVALSTQSYVNPATPLVSKAATVIFTIIAILEFINYYFVQLQHFDNLADFKRLISGKGFRRSHLARAIARHRDKS